MNISLNFINQSSMQQSANVVIYQINTATLPGTPVVAWIVIQNCGFNCNHPFTLEQFVEIGAADSNGNFSPRLRARPGQAFKTVTQASGHNLILNGTSSNGDEIQIENGLDQVISAMVYQDNRIVSRWGQIGPGDTANFSFKPTIMIGVAPGVSQGQMLDPADLADITTELSLLGVQSAEIIMTGSGASDDPYHFKLKNTYLT